MTVTLYQKAIEVISSSGSAPSVPVELNVAQMAIEVALPSAAFWPVSGMINGTWTAEHAISLKRQSHICQPGQHATLTIDDGFDFVPNPSDPVSLYEYGTLVLTGYVISVTRKSNEGVMEVEVDDTYTKVINTFIEDQKYTTEGHSVSYWIGTIMGFCGASWTYNKLYQGQDTDRAVPAGVQIGLRSAHESLQDIITFASWYVYVRADGKIIFGPKAESTFKNIKHDMINIEKTVNTDQTRNVVKVYGGSMFGKNITYTGSWGVDGLVVNMTSVIGSPLIQTQAEAQRVATYMLDELGHLSETITCEIAGDPTLAVGQRVTMTFTSPFANSIGGIGILTSLESNISASGYTMSVTLGEHCPRISGYSTYVPPVYAGTQKYGVWVSYDKGANWAEFNVGLPSGPKSVKRIASNMFGEVMAIVNNDLFYSASGAWAKEVLPAPTFAPGDSSSLVRNLVAVDALGGEGQFAVLVNGGSGYSNEYVAGGRSWVFERTSGSDPESGGSGTTGSAQWASTPISVIDETTGSSSYNATGYDLNSRNGAVYVLAATSSGSGYWPPPSGCFNGWSTISYGSVVTDELEIYRIPPWAANTSIGNIKFSYQVISVSNGYYGEPFITLDVTFSYTFYDPNISASVWATMLPYGETVSPLVRNGMVDVCFNCGNTNPSGGISYSLVSSTGNIGYPGTPGDYSVTRRYIIWPDLSNIAPGSTYTTRVGFYAHFWAIQVGPSLAYEYVAVGGGRVGWCDNTDPFTFPIISLSQPFGITAMGQLCEPTY